MNLPHGGEERILYRPGDDADAGQSPVSTVTFTVKAQGGGANLATNSATITMVKNKVLTLEIPLLDPKKCSNAAPVDCSTLPNVASTENGWFCANGVCNVASGCQAKFGDCDGNPSNGCETPLTDANNCGGCSLACTVGKTCVLQPSQSYKCM
jgi:hypothetical protein